MNTCVAEVLSEFADELEGAKDFTKELNALILRTIKEHKRIIFNGDGYSEEWVREAEKRGLLNLPSTPEALVHLLDEKNVAVFKKFGVYSETELKSRFEIHNENYSKIVKIEAETMLEMANKLYLPAASRFGRRLSDAINAKRAANARINVKYEEKNLERVSDLTGQIFDNVEALSKVVAASKDIEDASKLAFFCREHILPAMNALRSSVDQLEVITPKDLWPVPSYGDVLYSVV